jgi:hypothetical protein
LVDILIELGDRLFVFNLFDLSDTFPFSGGELEALWSLVDEVLAVEIEEIF